jgi:hypothetical protein
VVLLESWKLSAGGIPSSDVGESIEGNLEPEDIVELREELEVGDGDRFTSDKGSVLSGEVLVEVLKDSLYSCWASDPDLVDQFILHSLHGHQCWDDSGVELWSEGGSVEVKSSINLLSLLESSWVEFVECLYLAGKISENRRTLGQEDTVSDNKWNFATWVELEHFWSLVLLLQEADVNFLVGYLLGIEQGFDSSGWLGNQVVVQFDRFHIF